MDKIIDQTEIVATAHLKSFGFNEDQVNALVTQGKKDLQKELQKLKVLLENGSVEDINNALHALKGLFSQLGNHKVADRLNEIRTEEESQERLKEISELLFEI